MSESRKPSSWERRRHGPDPSKRGRRRTIASLAVLLPLVALIAAILPSSAMAAGLSGTSINGRVVSSDAGGPLSGITVTAIDTTTPGNGGQTATTDSNGDYTLNGLTSGDYYYLEFSSPDMGANEYYDEAAGSTHVTTSASTAAAAASSDSGLDAAGHADTVDLLVSGLNNTSITGTLYNNDTGNPMSGVTVTAIDATNSANGGQTATTDSSGDYTLSGLASGDEYYLSYAASGYVTQYYDESSYYGLTASSSQAAADALAGDNSFLDYYGEAYDEYLMSGGAVNGTLTFPTGTSPDGEVEVYIPGGNTYYGYVYADGSYSVPGVPAGSRYVVEYDPSTSAQDYVWYGGSSGAPSFSESAATQLAVTSGQLLSGVDFSAAATAKVTGTVSGPGGPLHTVDVTLYDLSGGYQRSTGTNSAGQFTITGRIDPGTYYLEAYDYNSSDNLAPAFSGTFSVAAGGTATENITMSAGGTITGTITGPTGSELTGSDVYITAVDGSYENWASVNASGTYTFQGVPAGSYYVEWEPAGVSYPYVWYDGSSLAAIEQNAEAITVSNGQSTTANFSNIPQAGEIRGTVTDAALGQPVSGVDVEVFDSLGNYVTDEGTGNDGSYDITSLLPGSYKVQFIPNSGARVAGDPAPDLAFQYYNDANSFTAASTLTVGAGQTLNGINAALGAGGTVSGRVTNAATGAGVPDDYVELLDTSAQEVDWARTNPDGTYTIYGVAPGSYYVEFDTASIGAGETVPQFYPGKPTLAGATLVSVTAGQAVQNINAALGMLTVPPAPTVPPVTVPAAVTPVVHLLSHSGLVKGGRLGVRLACLVGAACHGSLKVTAREVVYVKHGKRHVRRHRTVTIGTTRYSVSAGQAKTLIVRLDGAGRRALAGAKSHRLSVTITATVSGGKKATRHERIWTASKHKK